MSESDRNWKKTDLCIAKKFINTSSFSWDKKQTDELKWCCWNTVASPLSSYVIEIQKSASVSVTHFNNNDVLFSACSCFIYSTTVWQFFYNYNFFVCVCVIVCVYVHVHPFVKNQNTDRWLLDVFAECLLLISGSCCAQWNMQQHLNTALCDMTWGYNEAIHSSAAIFIHEQECMEWVTWAVWSWFPVWARRALIWSTLSSRLSEVPSVSSMVWIEMISDRSISCSSVKLCACVIS